MSDRGQQDFDTFATIVLFLSGLYILYFVGIFFGAGFTGGGTSFNTVLLFDHPSGWLFFASVGVWILWLGRRKLYWFYRGATDEPGVEPQNDILSKIEEVDNEDD